MLYTTLRTIQHHTHFPRYVKMELFRKNNIDVFCLDLRRFYATSLFPNIYGTIINQYQNITGHYKTCRDRWYEQKKTFYEFK